jgi:hypothetical protein
MVGNYPNIPSGYTAKKNSTRQFKLGCEKGSRGGLGRNRGGNSRGLGRNRGGNSRGVGRFRGRTSRAQDGRTREHSAETAEGTEEDDSYVQLRTQRWGAPRNFVFLLSLTMVKAAAGAAIGMFLCLSLFPHSPSLCFLYPILFIIVHLFVNHHLQ